MRVDEFKKQIVLLFGKEIKFDGHVEKVIDSINEQKQSQILDWIKDCISGLERPEPCKNIPNTICFIYKSNDNKIRGILTKEKNSYFIELFLDNHKYYDRKRKYLGL